MKRKTVIQIIVLVAIAAILVGLFFAKRASVAAELTEPIPVASQSTVEEGGTAEETLPLFVTSIDEEELRSGGLPVMIQFFSTSCVPCQSMMEDLRAFYSESYGRVRVVALNVEENPEAAAGYPVMVVPTQLFITASGEDYVPSQRIIGSVGGFTAYSYSDTGELAYVVHQGVLTKSQMERITAEAAGL